MPMKPFTVAWLSLGSAVAGMAQFIPGKPVVIHPAVESAAQRKGDIKGPGAGLGTIVPAPPAPGRGAARGGARPPGTFPAPPATPEIGGFAATVEQKSQGARAAIEPAVTFDGLGEGFAGTTASRGGGQGGIDLSIAVGPDHIFEVLNGYMAVFSKKGRKYGETGKLLYGAVPNNTVFAGFGDRCSSVNNADTVVRYDRLAERWLIVLPVFARPYAM